ncbi:hypothetical protein [Niveispirillum irakense]|uniref:hypothetical protein n=1 Tax=Niveispirillum irakense TaxID=34011 RepID=UPI001377A2B1|nr:hypothetical protein [Niveispirillum irakense]
MAADYRDVEAAPPKLLDRCLRLLIPPAAREAVLGDLWERYRSPLQYASEGIRVVPYVVTSRARRTSSIPIVGLQIFSLFACLGGFEPDRADAPVANALRAGLPALLALAGLILRSIYRQPETPARRGILDAVTAAIIVVLSQLAISGLQSAGMIGPGWTLSPSIYVLGILALPVLCIIGTVEGKDGDIRPPPATTLDSLISDYQAFTRGVEIRNWVEMGALTIIIIGSGYFLIRFKPPILPVGVSFVTGYVVILAYLALRGWTKAIPSNASLPAARETYQAELVRQNKIRRLMWWFWFVPLFAGLLTNLLMLGITKGDIVRLVAGMITLPMLGFFIIALNRIRTRNVAAKVAELGAIPA